MNKKQRNLRLTDAEYEAVKQMLKDRTAPRDTKERKIRRIVIPE